MSEIIKNSFIVIDTVGNEYQLVVYEVTGNAPAIDTGKVIKEVRIQTTEGEIVKDLKDGSYLLMNSNTVVRPKA